MITRARLMLECPECRESKLISVTIIDDVVGPFMCQSCVVQTTMARRLRVRAGDRGRRSLELRRGRLIRRSRVRLDERVGPS